MAKRLEETQRFEQLAQRIIPQGVLRRAWELEGGVSARTTALEIEGPDGDRQTVVMRRHGDVDFNHNPNIAADEYRLLEALQTLGIAAPRPLYLGAADTVIDRPYIVIEYVEGETEFEPADETDNVQRLAAQLAAIHRADSARLDLSFLPRQEESETARINRRPAHLDASLSEERIRGFLESAWPVSQRNPPALLHGDFWPGNVLWKEGRIAAVIDWEDAALGDPLADLANSRLEILFFFGPDALHHFTLAYLHEHPAINVTNLPYWDLCAALRPASKLSSWGLDEDTKHTMRERHALFVNQAFEQMGR